MTLQVVYLPYAVPIPVPKPDSGPSPILFDVNPVYGEKHTLERSEEFFNIRLINSNSNVAAGVALSFSNTSLKVDISDPSSIPESGDENNPSYVIPPYSPSNQFRDIKIIRGSGAPTGEDENGDPNTVNCSISYTLSNNEVVEYTTAFIVESAPPIPSEVHEIIRYFADPIIPSYEFKYDGNFNNTGSIGGLSSASSLQATPSTDYQGFVGYAETTSGSSRHHINNVSYSSTLRNTDRSWIFAFHIHTESFGNRICLLHGNNFSSGPGWFQTSGDTFKFTYVASNSSGSTLTLDNTHNHTQESNSKKCTSDNGKTILICASYDASASTTTYRWKKSGDGVGHSYKVVSSVSGQTSSGSARCTFVGWSSGSYGKVRHLNTTIIDALVSEDDFNLMADAMRLEDPYTPPTP